MDKNSYKIDFPGLVRMYHAQALIYLGAVKNPLTDKIDKNLQQAQLLIDILQLLKEKTINNLTADEVAMLEKSLERLEIEMKKEQN